MHTHGWLYAAAGYNLAFALFHVGFWRIFRWREELPRLQPLNRGVMQVMNLILIFVLLGMAAWQVVFADELAVSPPGRALLAGLTGLWLVRAVLQPVFFRHPPAVRWGFTVVFLAGAGLHAAAWWGG